MKYFFVLNKILIVFTCCVFGYFCFKLFFPLKRIDISFVNTDQTVNLGSLKNTLSIPVKSYGHYREQLQKRDVFQFPEDKPTAASKKVSVKKAVKSLVSKAPKAVSVNSLKLVGIILDKNPEAIVEDPKKRETLFLRKGDEIEGAIVEEILEGKVIFLYEGRKVELVQ